MVVVHFLPTKAQAKANNNSHPNTIQNKQKQMENGENHNINKENKNPLIDLQRKKLLLKTVTALSMIEDTE